MGPEFGVALLLGYPDERDWIGEERDETICLGSSVVLELGGVGLREVDEKGTPGAQEGGEEAKLEGEGVVLKATRRDA